MCVETGTNECIQLVNRKERLTMYRIWMQVKAKKLA